MYQVLQLLTLFLFTGSTCAVFYIPGSVVSYPKMGKRAFYTNATGNRYPLMGRRSSPTNSEGQGQVDTPTAAEVAVAGAMVQNGDEFTKRGVFTQGQHRSYPRIGRSDGAGENSEATVSGKIRNEILKNLAERLNRNVLSVLGADSDLGSLNAARQGESIDSLKGLQLPQFLFLIFDEDGDNLLSKEEFTSGLDKVLEQNLFC